MAVTLSNLKREDAGSQTKVSGTITFDSSYATGGESVSASVLGLAYIENMEIDDSEGYTYDCDIAAGGATANVKVYNRSSTILAENIKLTDDDTAASNGVAIYLHTKNGNTGWLEFVSPTNADATLSLTNGGNELFVFDSDAAATDGVAVYFDEDATVVDERLMAVCQSNQNVYIPTSSGNKLIKIKDNDTAATDGVQVYLDENGTNAYDRLLFVSPTNTDGTGSTDDEYASLAQGNALVEVPSTTDLSSVAVDFECLGR